MVFFYLAMEKTARRRGAPFEIKGDFDPSRDDLALLAGKGEPENYDYELSIIKS